MNDEKRIRKLEKKNEKLNRKNEKLEEKLAIENSEAPIKEENKKKIRFFERNMHK